jgi:hypothetical protein
VKGGLLALPKKKVRRFGVVEGGAGGAENTTSTPTATPARTPTPTPTPTPAPTSTPAEPPSATPRPRVPFGVILGGKSDRKD